jgi:3-hydroxyisobutyrate dehydrogenase-like beta-hydroxyacid dehydrogenase
MRIGFVGLGVMGFPMAGHLARAGHDVTVFNRTRSKAERWGSEFGGTIADSPADAARGASAVCTMVGDDPDVRAVTFDAGGVLETIDDDALLIDHTSASAALARELAAAHTAFVDAPVSGGQAGAESGQLTIMCGGEPAHYERAAEIMGAYAKATTHIGGVGDGQLAKMCNQICIAGIVQSLAEALHFADRAGIDQHAVIAAISQGAAGSWQMTNRAPTMIEGRYDFGFAVDWMRKDLRNTLTEARESGARLPLTALVDQFYADVQADGGGRLDTSSLRLRLGQGSTT